MIRQDKTTLYKECSVPVERVYDDVSDTEKEDNFEVGHQPSEKNTINKSAMTPPGADKNSTVPDDDVSDTSFGEISLLNTEKEDNFEEGHQPSEKNTIGFMGKRTLSKDSSAYSDERKRPLRKA